MDHHFSWYHFVPGLSQLPVHVAGAIVVATLLIAATAIARFSLSGLKDAVIPAPKINFLNLWEMIAEGLYKFTKSILGEDAKKYLPLSGTIFLYVLFSNFIGYTPPGFAPPTDNMNTALAIGLFVFVYYNWVGIKASGWSYLKHFCGPIWWMGPFLLCVELISHMVRPFSLGLRLSGNMTGDHMVLSVMTGLAESMGIGGFILPIPFYILGTLICFIQAFVFTLLTMVYIAMARDTAHH